MRRNEPRVGLVWRPKSRIWVIRYRDPDTGRIVQRSTGTKDKREAERQAGALRADLANDRCQAPNNIAWQAFRSRYEDEHLPSLAPKTRLKVATVLDAAEEFLRPTKLRDVNAEQLSKFQAALRKRNLSENTIRGYMGHFKAALNWAVTLGLLHRVPKIQMPRRAKSSSVMKGRPITEDEFKRMLAATVAVVGEAAAPSWEFYLRGLILSGLRLQESLDLFWDDDSKLCIVFEGTDMLLRVPAGLEKGNKDRMMAMAPEFVDFLSQTPSDERTGRVFKLTAQKVHGERLTADRVTRIVANIGRKAGVIVDQARNKYASAHDLRRSFGERWAARVMPQVLMELMRHESIETTLRFYVGKNARRTTKVLREAYEHHSKNSTDQLKSDTSSDTQPAEDSNGSK